MIDNHPFTPIVTLANEFRPANGALLELSHANEVRVIAKSVQDVPVAEQFEGQNDIVLEGRGAESIYWTDDLYKLNDITNISSEQNYYYDPSPWPEDPAAQGRLQVEQAIRAKLDEFKQFCKFYGFLVTILGIASGITAFLSLSDLLFKPSKISALYKLLYTCLSFLSVPGADGFEKVSYINCWSPMYYVRTVLYSLVSFPIFCLFLETILVSAMALSKPVPHDRDFKGTADQYFTADSEIYFYWTQLMLKTIFWIVLAKAVKRILKKFSERPQMSY